MKRYTIPSGRVSEHQPEHPERTARRAGIGIFADDIFQVWPNRPSMARSIRMQERGADFANAWRAYVPLTPGEGY